MKKYIPVICMICSLALFTLPLKAEEPMVEKTKTYTKSYTLSGSDKVTLDNQFGEMKINTWDKNEIRVDVNIVAKAGSDQSAQKILDNITIEDSKSGSGVSFRTQMKNKNGNWNDDGDRKGYKDMGMKIDYTVYMPAGNPLSATNQFGPMTVPDYRGTVVLVSKFGSLNAGKLSDVKEVNVEFGKADIESVNGGKLTIKFSKATIGMFSGNVEARFEFCDKLKLGVDNNAKDLNIRTSYSNLYLNTPTNYSSTIEIKTSFGEFNNRSNFQIRKEGDDDEKYGPKFDKSFSGTAGSGSNKLRIKSDFGEVTIGHNLEVDMNEKKKVKV